MSLSNPLIVPDPGDKCPSFPTRFGSVVPKTDTAVYAYGVRGAKRAIASFLKLDPWLKRSEMGPIPSAVRRLILRIPRMTISPAS